MLLGQKQKYTSDGWVNYGSVYPMTLDSVMKTIPSPSIVDIGYFGIDMLYIFGSELRVILIADTFPELVEVWKAMRDERERQYCARGFPSPKIYNQRV